MTADRCICDGAAYHNAEENRARHPFIVNPGCPVHAPVTADHTPERQSLIEPEIEALAEALADDMEAAAAGKQGFHLEQTVERIVAAHLADVEARLAAWHSWAGTWLADYPDGETPRMRELRAALHPDPSGPAGGKP